MFQNLDLYLIRPVFYVCALIIFFFPGELKSQEWQDIEDSLHPRVEALRAQVNGKIYIFSGFTEYTEEEVLEVTKSSEVLNPALIGSTDGPWQDIIDIPLAVTHVTPVVVDEDIWIIGGFEGNNPGVSIKNVQMYNTSSQSWSEGPELPEPMASHGAAKFGNTIHVFGGLLPDRMSDNDAHYRLDLDKVEEGWKEAKPMPMARNHFGTVTLAGKIYAIGGQFGHDGNWRDQSYVHAYDPIQDSWKRLSDLTLKRSHFEPGTFSYNGRIYIVGGRNEDDNVILDDITQYDPEQDKWTNLDKLPKRALAPVAATINNEIFVTHGGNTYKEPDTHAFKKTFYEENKDALGIFPLEINETIENETDSKSIDIHVWTLNAASDYEINTAEFPSWLAISAEEAVNKTDPTGKKLIVQLTPEGLEEGEYTHEIIVNAPGYSPISLPVQLQVENTTITGTDEDLMKEPNLTIFPNPSYNQSISIELRGLKSLDPVTVKIWDTLGKLVFQKELATSPKGSLAEKLILDKPLSPGIYYLTAASTGSVLKTKLVRE